MKLLSISLARSLWLFNLADLNPRGKNVGPPLFEYLLKKYRFAQAPKTKEELDDTKGIVFLNGAFEPEQGDPIQIALKIFNWGIAAETRSSTQDSDAFILEVLEWTTKHFSLPPYEAVLRSKAYLSEVYVHTERSLHVLNPKLEHITSRLNAEVKGHGDLSYQPAGIMFWNDPSINQSFPFRFERAEGVGFKENRYYSIAPLGTEAHLTLLDELEDLLS